MKTARLEAFSDGVLTIAITFAESSPSTEPHATAEQPSDPGGWASRFCTGRARPVPRRPCETLTATRPTCKACTPRTSVVHFFASEGVPTR